MSWPSIRLIWFHEVRSQLRDRRTLFTIAVLPVLLYPLLGMTVLQMTQFLQEHPTRIWVVGAANLPSEPPLVVAGRFAPEFCPASEARLLDLEVTDALPGDRADRDPRSFAQREIRDGTYDAVVYFPPLFSRRLAALGMPLGEPRSGPPWAPQAEAEAIRPRIFANLAADKSRVACDRVKLVLGRWRDEIVRRNLEQRQVSPALAQPFEITGTDVSEAAFRRTAIWAKLLPFVAFVWALTGAFYPAVDLCAGEKERGTLETLLCSPATRDEIVWGKLLTVMSFSIATALLNLLGISLTGQWIMGQMAQVPNAALPFDLGTPPVLAVVWLLLTMLPISAVFSALSLAVAAFARSTKEGQYYLVPLLLAVLPLLIAPLLPSAQLDLGVSLIPLYGIALWLKALIGGEYVESLRYAIPVLGVTAGCCWLAIRWAVHQFDSEGVLFRESERFGPALWLRHLVRDSGETPSVAEAILCGVLLLLMTFFAGLRAELPENWQALFRTALVMQLGLIAAPPLIMAIILTKNVRRTLGLNKPRWTAVPAAGLLAIALHPLMLWLGRGIEAVYPIREETLRALEPLANAMREAPLGYVLLVVALAPAICEELAFRGFILSGLRGLGSKWVAIGISSLLFGLTHGLLQQSLAAAAVGLFLGFVAVQAGSLLPCVVFHFSHNALSVVAGRLTPEVLEALPWLGWFYRRGDSSGIPYMYQDWVTGALAAVAVLILLWFHRFSMWSGGDGSSQTRYNQHL